MGKPDTLSDRAGELPDPSRRTFMKGASGLTLGLSRLGGAVSSTFVGQVLAEQVIPSYRSAEDLYRKEWRWDKVTWGSHTNVCLPGSCSFHVYVKDGMVWREEQAANNPASNPNYPDYNPLGCQKGCSFHANIYGDERVKYPLQRVGERGEGKWQRISWEDALTRIAEGIVDALEEQGPDAFILDPPHAHLGSVGWAGAHRMTQIIGGVSPDLNVLIGDFFKGCFDTVGKQHTGYSADNLFDAELIFLTCSNWSYTMPAIYHFLTEARYNGTELVSISPDYNPTAITCDYHVPIRQGCDAAFWLGVSKVMMDEGLVNVDFVRSQTDLPLLVRRDNGRFLRQIDLDGSGREDQLYFYDRTSASVVKAPRGTLAFDGDQALEGDYEVTLADGTQVIVTPVYQTLTEQLADYTPQRVHEMSGVHPTLLTRMARKVASKVTCSYIGFTSAKIYHGDLAERALILAMALSGNWGKPGTGWNCWATPGDPIEMLMVMEKPVREGGLEAIAQIEHAMGEKLRAEDPDVSDELISIELIKAMTTQMGQVPPVFLLHYHAGYKELYDNQAWADPALKRSFSEYLDESIEKGWWKKEHIRPAPETTPRVYMITSGNPLRRLRSGMIKYREELFPKLTTLFAIEPRMSTSAMFCDIVLPAAWYYEKKDMTVSITNNPRFCLIEKAVEPQGEARPEWEIYAAILHKVGEVAAARGLTGYTDFFGQQRRYDQLWSKFTMNGAVVSQEQALEEMVTIAAVSGIFPEGYTMADFERDGVVEQQGFGLGFMKHLVANEYNPRKPFYSLRWHVDNQKIYPTYTRRAQFYIDHEWYLEAGEALPVHKDPPKIGGDHPYYLTGGHPRHSVHSVHLSQPLLLKLHRGQPVMHINPQDAGKKGLADGDWVRVHNDYAHFEIMVRTSPTIQPTQCVIYFWEGYQFRDWNIYDNLLIGMPKPLHLAGGYEQLRFYFLNGSPGPSTDRGVRVDLHKIEEPATRTVGLAASDKA